MDDRDGAALGLADVLLERLSPEERDLLAVLGPSMLSAGVPRSDGALGFGVTDMAWLTVVIPVAKPVIDYLLDVAKDVLTDVAKEQLTAWLGSLSGRSPASLAAPPPVLPREAAKTAGQVAYRHAVTLGLDDERAQVLRDAVIGSLVTPVR
jgi:hypothetical protein